ncbi:MAG: molybdate ABC transporter substrate-binding protein [Acidobacteriota bacterium]|nr:molybdate ABC transporter substrate-binding protein [Acidobacteriota bacterium]
MVALAALCFFLAVCGLSAGCGAGGSREGSAEPPLRVFAAASLSEALGEVAAAYRAAGGETVELNLAGSNVLARQIVAGAPADFFLSADARQMEVVQAAGRVREEEVFELLTNRLVVVVPRTSPVQSLASLAELEGFDRLALADPAAVPAGVYARRWIEASAGENLWARLEPRIVPAADVRAALAAVAGGHLPAGIVYASDVSAGGGVPAVRVVWSQGEGEEPRIAYPAAPVQGGRGAASRGWGHFLRGDRAMEIFRRHGFSSATPGIAGTSGSSGA